MGEIDVKQLALAVKAIAEEKNLPDDVVLEVIEQAVAAAWRRDHGEREQEVRAEMNINTGATKVFVSKEVVDEVKNEALEINLKDAKKIKPDAKVGDNVEISETATTFGRVAAQTAKQVVLQRLREAEREAVVEAFDDKIDTVITGTVQRVEPRVVRIDLGQATGILPASEQIPGEYYQPGARLKVYLKEVERGYRGPQLVLSRANETFVEYLFRQEVPEMESGAVEIKAIAREAGKRTKIAVHSSVPGVDPVGTFVGGHGTRVQAVMNEIGEQEKIDIITYDEDPVVFITNALSPAEVKSIEIEKKGEEKRAKVVVNEDQQSIAIGRGGQNVRLASKLTGYELDIEASETKAAPKKPRKNIEDSLLDAVEASSENSDQKDKN